MKKTPLYEEHLKLGAKMAEFAGWEVPIQYTSVKEEHLNVRNNVGMFDVSHMGQVFVSGKDALAYLQHIVPQDLTKVTEEKAVYSFLVNENGGIIDDLIIYRMPDENETYKFFIIVNASRIENDMARFLEKKENYDVKIENKSEEFSLIAVQGPKATNLIDVLGLKQEEQPKRFHIKETNLNGIDMLLARTGYTGEDGFELVIKNEDAVKLWQELLIKGEAFGLKPAGFAARDTLRLEASLPLYGQDMTEQTTPVEASLTWAISKEKEDNYPGKDKILNQIKNNQLKKKLFGFKMLDKSVPRHDYEIYIDNKTAGQVTSGGFSPCNNGGIGMGYISTPESLKEGSKIDIMIRGKLHPAQIVKKPFYSKK